jgi:hypothetical protein
MASAFGPFKRTAKTMFQPTSEAMKGFTGRSGSFSGNSGDEFPACHDVSKVPAHRPPTKKVFKVATEMRKRQDGDCALEFSEVMSCIGQDGPGNNCEDCYEALKACLGSSGAGVDTSGLISKKYHIERVYGGFGNKTRQRRGKGQKS